MLVVRDLAKRFIQSEQNIDVLRTINLTVEAGDTVAIVGQSGCGKSTLLSLLAGLDSSSSGQIVVDGLNIAGLSERAMAAYRAQNLAIVFQQFHLLEHLTALENISLPLEILGRKQVDEQSSKALAAVGLSHRRDHYPTTLSGGEQQRVAIARALVVQPKLLLADEPSGSLDVETGERVMDLLFKLCSEQGTTMILVTHDLAIAKRCRRSFRLKDGVLEAIDMRTAL